MISAAIGEGFQFYSCPQLFPIFYL